MPLDPQTTRTQQAFEETLRADPQDRATHSAWADWLSEQEDPTLRTRGEFTQVQLALEDPSLDLPEHQQLQRREEELFRRHGREWLGELAPHFLEQHGIEPYGATYGLVFRYRFVRGWLDFVQIPLLTAPIARALCTLPVTKLLRRLVIQRTFDRNADFTGVDPYHAGLLPLYQAPFLDTIRVFQFGADAPNEYTFLGDDYGEHNPYFFIASPGGGGIPPLVQRMSRLEELRLFSNDIDGTDIFDLPMPHLRVLQLYHCFDYPLELLAANDSLTQLTQLLFHPHAPYADECYLELPAIRALVHSPHLHHLKHLQLRLSNMGDAGIHELITSGMLRHLEALDLRHGCVTDEGVRTLVNSNQTQQLHLLDLQRNRLTDVGMDLIKTLGISTVRLENQQQPAADGSYTDDYLYEGDWE